LTTSLFPCLSAAAVELFLSGVIAAGNGGKVCVGGNEIDGASGLIIVPLTNRLCNVLNIAYSSSSLKPRVA